MNINMNKLLFFLSKQKIIRNTEVHTKMGLYQAGTGNFRMPQGEFSESPNLEILNASVVVQ